MAELSDATATTDTPPSRETLLARAAALVPVLRERAAEAERLRRIPDETVRDLVASGLMRVGNPDRFGGYGAAGIDYDLAYEIGEELARACPSTSWCYIIWTTHSWMVGHWPIEAQEEFWADGPDTLACTSFRGTGATVEATDGGYLVSGRWEFSSGCDASAWVLLGGSVGEQRLNFLIPRADWQIVDDWYVAGARGTGSKDVVIESPVFVPARRATGVIGGTDAGTSTGWQIHHRPSYFGSARGFLGFNFAAVVLGAAQGALDAFVASLQPGGSRHHLATAGSIQQRVNEAAAEIDTARLIIRHDTGLVIERGRQQEPLTAMEIARCQRDVGFMTKLCLNAVNRLYEVSGGHGIRDTDPMQRFHRDIHALSHRDSLILDLTSDQYCTTLLDSSRG